MGRQIPIHCVIMRGGTSKGLFLRGNDLPRDQEMRDRVILALFGSPDPRQIDGLGGADILTSKVIIVDPPSRPDADLDYTFGQVSISEPCIDYDINCGNLSAAVGVYAVEEGWVRAKEPVTHVRMHNTNTQKILIAEVPVRDGAPQVEGDLAIDGVPGTGAEIVLDYAQSVGASTGKLLPTGRPVERIHVQALDRAIPMSVVDIANLCVFFPAEAVGMKGTEGPQDLTSDHMAAILAIKTEAARLLDLPEDGLVPLPVAVAPSRDYRTFTGKEVHAGEIHLLARLVGGRPPVMHKAFAATAAVCTAVAAAIPGTVPFDLSRRHNGDGFVIGHPSGTFSLRVRVAERDGAWIVERAAYSRTARRLMEGYAFIRSSVLEG